MLRLVSRIQILVLSDRDHKMSYKYREDRYGRWVVALDCTIVVYGLRPNVESSLPY